MKARKRGGRVAGRAGGDSAGGAAGVGRVDGDAGKATRGLTLDTGALIAFERNERQMVALLHRAFTHRLELAVPAGVLAQAWRDGGRQARLAALVAAPEVEVVSLDGVTARAIGRLCGARRTDDIVDASVALCARVREHAVVTSDSEDIARLDPELHLIEV